MSSYSFSKCYHKVFLFFLNHMSSYCLLTIFSSFYPSFYISQDVFLFFGIIQSCYYTFFLVTNVFLSFLGYFILWEWTFYIIVDVFLFIQLMISYSIPFFSNHMSSYCLLTIFFIILPKFLHKPRCLPILQDNSILLIYLFS